MKTAARLIAWYGWKFTIEFDVGALVLFTTLYFIGWLVRGRKRVASFGAAPVPSLSLSERVLQESATAQSSGSSSALP